LALALLKDDDATSRASVIPIEEASFPANHKRFHDPQSTQERQPLVTETVRSKSRVLVAYGLDHDKAKHRLYLPIFA
jgi:hypothetical protein